VGLDPEGGKEKGMTQKRAHAIGTRGEREEGTLTKHKPKAKDEEAR